MGLEQQLFWPKNENGVPRRPESGEASKAKHDEQAVDQMVDLISR